MRIEEQWSTRAGSIKDLGLGRNVGLGKPEQGAPESRNRGVDRAREAKDPTQSGSGEWGLTGAAAPYRRTVLGSGSGEWIEHGKARIHNRAVLGSTVELGCKAAG